MRCAQRGTTTSARRLRATFPSSSCATGGSNLVQLLFVRNTVTLSTIRLAPAPEVRLHPPNLRPPDIPRGNAQGEEGERRPLHLLQLIVCRPRDPERAGDCLPREVPHARKHGHAAVLDLGLAVALDVVEVDAGPGKAEGSN